MTKNEKQVLWIIINNKFQELYPDMGQLEDLDWSGAFEMTLERAMDTSLALRVHSWDTLWNTFYAQFRKEFNYYFG